MFASHSMGAWFGSTSLLAWVACVRALRSRIETKERLRFTGKTVSTGQGAAASQKRNLHFTRELSRI